MKKIGKIIGALIFSTFILFVNPSNIKAASATFKTTASTSKVVVGKTFTVTVKISAAEALGSWEYTIDYNSSVLSLVSGSKAVAGYGDGAKKSQSYTYTFKAIKAGSSKISVKSYNAISWKEVSFSSSVSSSTVKVITQADLAASYSKDNNLKSLSVDNTTLSPEFKADVTDYSVQLDSNTTSINIKASANHSKASVNGTGTFNVIEGENKFTLTVTAENGSEKKYNIIANVVDPNPIKVNVDNKSLTVVKRVSALTIPESYTETTAQINGQEVPAFTSEITNFTLVGLKDNEGNIQLYVYDNGNFSKYIEFKLNDLILYPLNEEIPNLNNYEKIKLNINNDEVTAYRYRKNSNFAILKAIDTETGKKDTYMYDIKNNTVIAYNDEAINDLSTKNQTYLYIIIGLLTETFILFILLILLLKKRSSSNKRKKEKIEKVKKINKENKKENKDKKEEEKK